MIVVAVNLRTNVTHESLQTCPTSKALTCASAHAYCKLSLSWVLQARLVPVREGRQGWDQRAAALLYGPSGAAGQGSEVRLQPMVP